MTSGGNNFNDFSEIVLTREITTKIEKTFLFLVLAYLLNGPNAAASVAPTLIRHWHQLSAMDPRDALCHCRLKSHKLLRNFAINILVNTRHFLVRCSVC